MSDIQFTYEGRQVVVPFSLGWMPSGETLSEIRGKFPDAHIVPSHEKVILPEVTLWNGWHIYAVEEPRT